MFRKLIHIVISFLLLSVTAGYSISKHYCGNNLVSVSISHEAENCCRNETKSYHLDEDFVISPILENNFINCFNLFAIYYILLDNKFDFEIITDFVIPESPPPVKTQTKLSNLQTYLC
ncbi:MAG: hypothetical protein KAQ75_04065 [Bacteroidales bacterium]|nr:hypothetical protein [Bacteroidales bacterium]